MHVSEHKVDCTHCHLEIQHVGEPQVRQATTSCSACHLKGHGPQMNLYAGIGGRGVEPMPDPMFVAGVRCEGCHLEIPGREVDTRRASDISCMSCHGPGYRKIFDSWKQGISSRVTALGQQMSRTESALGADVPASFEDARFNLSIVHEGSGVHNVAYASALLTRAHGDMNKARSDAGLPELSRPWSQAPYESACLRCHIGVEEQAGRVFGRRFKHARHVVSAGLECNTCHYPHDDHGRTLAPEEGAVRHAKSSVEAHLRFGAAGCKSCHHQEPAADCATCHSGVFEGPVSSDLGDFDHSMHIEATGLDCTDCHDLTPGQPVKLNGAVCADCHG
jgi:hypothetical protein